MTLLTYILGAYSVLATVLLVVQAWQLRRVDRELEAANRKLLWAFDAATKRANGRPEPGDFDRLHKIGGK